MSQPVYKKTWFLSSIVVVIITSIVLFNRTSNKNQSISQNKFIANNDSLALIEYYKKEEAKPCIHAPLEGINIPYTTYKVNAENGGTFDFKTGSKIVVPKNSFVDESGKLLKGEIELRYREFHDAIDFFVAGIPMTYDSAEVRYQFESAGMMEMQAYQNGKKVNMAIGKSINIELASNYKGTEYNLYKLDTLKNNWSCLGKDKVVEQATSKGVHEQSVENTTSVQETPAYKIIETKKIEVQKEKEIKIVALPKMATKPIKPGKADDEKFTFKLEVNPNEFPELSVFRNSLFEVGSENKNFNKAMYDITWDELIIKEGNKKGENYLLTLKKGSKKYDLIVYPIFEGKNYEIATKNYQDKFTKYNAALEKRKVDEKRIENEYQTKLAALKRQQQAIELKWKEEMDREFARMDTEEKVKRTFAINSFGVYNCDNPIAYPTGITCVANLLNDKNEKIMCYDIFLVDHSKNALFSYVKNPITKFSFNPKSSNLLWTVENGVLFWYKPEQFADINGSEGMSNLKMNRVDQKFKTVEELKTFFNL
jgi:hypothetical protein